MSASRLSNPAAWTRIRPRRRARNWGIAMKVLTGLVVVGLVGFIVINIINRDDIARYIKMRQM
jgi:hypothetical protein